MKSNNNKILNRRSEDVSVQKNPTTVFFGVPGLPFVHTLHDLMIQIFHDMINFSVASLFCTVQETLPWDHESFREYLALCQILTKTISNAVSYLATVGLWLASLFTVPLDTLFGGLQLLLFFQAKHCKPS